MKNIFCLIGIHCWKDVLDYTNMEFGGHYIVQGCFNCSIKRVYKSYDRFGECYLHQMDINKLNNKLKKELGVI